MKKNHPKVLAFDLDGTLTQHKTPLSQEYAYLLHLLSKKYRLIMVGAGSCSRIYQQMNKFPIDIIGNYGMQFSTINPTTGKFILSENVTVKTNAPLMIKRADELRSLLGYQQYTGKTLEIHNSGMLTFPILGTAALIQDKLCYDPSRKKRRAIYSQVVSMFPEYKVYIGGSSSFDIVPHPYSKLYALENYCSSHNLTHDDILYFGDDYGTGGNDEDLYLSNFHFQCIDDYRDFPLYANKLL